MKKFYLHSLTLLLAFIFLISTLSASLPGAMAASLTVTTDKEHYTPGNTLQVMGQGKPGGMVSIQIFDPSGMRKAIAQAQVAASGSYTVAKVLLFTGDDKKGTWTVQAYQSGEHTVATFTLTEAAAPSEPVQGFLLKVTEWGYNQTEGGSTITANLNEKVAVTIINIGTLDHDFVLPEFEVETNLLSPGQTQTVEFTPNKAGTFTYYCSIYGHREHGLEGKFIVKAAAEFRESNLEITPKEVKADEEVKISFAVKNIGDLAGTYKATLKINGAIEDTKTLTLTGGETKTVTFTISKKIIGIYNVDVAGLSGKFSVVTPTPTATPTPTPTKTPSSITVTVSPTQIDKGNSVTVTGSISPLKAAVPVTITFTKAGGVPVERTATTNSEGSFTTDYTPDAGGSWAVTASWEGDDEHKAVESSPTEFEVIDQGCLIATATYGSEMSAEVQFLRGFREQTVYMTFAGSQFMTAFNAWYYSFSPTLASFISDQPVLQSIMRGILYPLLGALHLTVTTTKTLGLSGELGILISGLLACTLIGAIYFAPLIAVALEVVRRRRRVIPQMRDLKLLLIPWILSLILMFTGEILTSPILMTVASTAFVILTVGLAGGTVALGTISRLVKLSRCT
jgi:uncharacterized cupredoxin-like copper-binding protein